MPARALRLIIGAEEVLSDCEMPQVRLNSSCVLPKELHYFRSSTVIRAETSIRRGR
jgi:hypothetical protein